MGVLKFTTKISESGTIQIPNHTSLSNQEVEIIIMPKSKQAKKSKSKKAAKFIDDWAGFLKNSDIDKSKHDYLTEKYQCR